MQLPCVGRKVEEMILCPLPKSPVTVREHPLQPGRLLINEGRAHHIAGDGDSSVGAAVNVSSVDLVRNDWALQRS